jgi:hypothetical protein
MKNYLKRVRECVKDLNIFAEVSLEIETKLSKEESLEFGVAVLETAKAVLRENRIPEIVSFLVAPESYTGAMKISEADENITLCHTIQEKATEICGDWNESAATLTLASFVLNEGVVEGVDTETKVTFGELFGLDEKHEDFAKETPITVAQRKELVSFAGEGSTLPLDTLGLIKLSLKYAPENEAVKAAWDALNIKTALHAECEGKFIPLVSTKDYSEEVIADLAETHAFSEELISGIKDRVELINKVTSDETSVDDLFALGTISFATLSVDLNEAVTEYLFGNKESYLLELVAITRSNNLTKEDVNSAVSKYKVFTKKSLSKLWSNLPEMKETPKVETGKTEESDAVQNDKVLEQTQVIVENSNENTPVSTPSTHNRLLDYYGRV